MKLLAVLGAGLIAVSGIAAAPAEAAPHDRWGRGPGWDRGPGGPHRGPGWDRGRGWDRGPGWHRGGYERGPGWRGYGRPRVTCRWVRTWNGPQRQCFRR
ncbi:MULTISPECIES: hypothetical protein [unclassified Sphingomonas]|uniref:hypothetical protein n=1 Tax=unclassified Sphingomonas TaxID=196159 RepID=UPI002788D2A5|nr:hypothetical protein [Sphingomonas sp. SORGH_AS_0879]MDQ1230211.1 hypothetical protein [Sphingomonas sp. SORGH_AS_0879]